MGHNNSAIRAESFRNIDRYSENHHTRLSSLGGELMTDRTAYRYHGARELSSTQQHLPHLNLFGDDRHAHHDYRSKGKHVGGEYHTSHETHKSSEEKHHGKVKHAQEAHERNKDSHKHSQKNDSQVEHSEKHPVQKSAEKDSKAENQKNQSDKSQVSTAEVQKVTASWYHEGRRTANGERFKPDGLTVAHKSLPFGTLLEIKNPDNGHTVVARVNDRGPFIKNRDIDLSRGAARQLGMLKKGVGEVEYKIVGHA